MIVATCAEPEPRCPVQTPASVEHALCADAHWASRAWGFGSPPDCLFRIPLEGCMFDVKLAGRSSPEYGKSVLWLLLGLLPEKDEALRRLQQFVQDITGHRGFGSATVATIIAIRSQEQERVARSARVYAVICFVILSRSCNPENRNPTFSIASCNNKLKV